MKRRVFGRIVGGAGTVGGAGMVPLAVQAQQPDMPTGILTPRQFGAKGDGVANDTAAMGEFLGALGDGGRGDWDTGTYRVDEGVLVLEPSSRASQIGGRGATLKVYRGPEITGTATFIGNNTGSGPFLTVRNPPQTSTSGSYYANGSLGNLYFVDNSGSKILTRHGLLLRGLYAWVIGVVHGFRLAGSVVSFSRDLGAGNPDPYGVTNCFFRAVRGEFCNAVTWDGDCLQESGNFVLSLGAGGRPASGIHNPNGAMINSGQGTEIRTSSMGAHYGWALHYGASKNGNRQICQCISLGGSEKGIWVQSLQQFTISGRIEGVVDAHEVNASIAAGTMVWPTTCLKIGGGRGVADGTIDLIIRVDTGKLAMLGPSPFIDLSNDPNISNVLINIVLIDNAGMGLIANSLLGIPVSQFVTNVHKVAGVTVKVNGFAVLSQSRSTAIRVRLASGAANATIPSTGFATKASKLGGAWEAAGPGNHMPLLNARNNWLNVRATGRYRLHCQLTLPVGSATGKISAGSLVKYALIDDDGADGLAVITEGTCLTVDAGGLHVVQMIVLSAFLQAGHRVWVSLQAAGQNGTCHLAVQTDASASNMLELALMTPD